MTEIQNEKKLILAPMATLSHEAFRRCVVKFGGCDEYFTEMINAGSLLNMGPFEKFYLMAGPEPEKIVWQLTGNDSGKMAKAAEILTELEGIGLDLNMGCSAPQIANTGAGISWMTKPIQETQTMVHGIKSAIENSAKDGKKPKRLSVKMRLGDEDFNEEKLFSFCQMLIDEGVEMFTLHPRTKKEKHRGHARWEFVEKLALRFPQIPVILNGDVKDRASFSEAIKTSPNCAGVMIATAAAQKPWIFYELKTESENLNDENSKIDAEQLALDFISDVEKYQPQEFWKTRLQRFFAYYCLNFSFGHYFQTQMLNAKDNDDARIRLKEYFEKCKNDKIILIK